MSLEGLAMAEHEMPFTGKDDINVYMALDEFTQGYVHAIFFTDVHSDNPEIQDATMADLAPETLEAIKQDCTAFQERNAELLAWCAEHKGYDAERAGMDYWFTRNGHGAGFWDRGLGDVGDRLSAQAKADGGRDLYAGDDGKLYLS